MTSKEKIALYKIIDTNKILNTDIFYDVLEKCGDLKKDYHTFMKTSPIDCDTELLRLPTAEYNLCCALLTMLLREDHFSNGAFYTRQRKGQVKEIIDRLIYLLEEQKEKKSFSEKALNTLNGFYVYALIDPTTDDIFYVGKGTDNRVFSHESEKIKSDKENTEKQLHIQKIKQQGHSVKKLIVNWGLTESEAFAAEATLINLLKYNKNNHLTNIVSGHHIHESLTTEEFEAIYGAIELNSADIKHSILVIKINKLYRRNMTDLELYNTVRGLWSASLKSIRAKKVEYVFGVYNDLIVAVYKPDEWHYTYEMIDIPQRDLLTDNDIERFKNRIYFICKNYKELDENGKFYLNKSIRNLNSSHSAQNPITYLSPETFNQ